MDIIYADENLRDLGVISGDLDVAFGKDENDFSLTIDLTDHCCKEGYAIYVEGTEYGGIIDTICPDSEHNELEYKGRSWHGIMEAKVLEPDKGYDYLVVNGDANSVLSELIKRMGLEDLFTVSSEASGMTVTRYQFERYIKGYTGIRNMLRSVHAKLDIKFVNKMVVLEAVPLYDYSLDEEWDESQMFFQIEKKYHPVNHLICLGSGDLKDRYVIHLFTDENGGIAQYTSISNPYQDTHYILDKSKQKIFGKDEITETYDNNNAGTKENYILLTSKPQNWDDTCLNYYTKNDDEKFSPVKKEEIKKYVVLSSKPSDWEKEYGNYFTKKENGDDYESVDGEESISYSLLTSRPADWDKNYSSEYYYWYSDGVKGEYKNVEPISKVKYNIQTSKPTDWSKNYTSYYTYKPVYQYVYIKKTKQKNGTWKKEIIKKDEKVDDKKTKTLILKFKKKVVLKWEYKNVESKKDKKGKEIKKAPSWRAKKYYTRENYDITPSFEQNKYYKKISVAVAPSFVSGEYYQKTKIAISPSWKTGTYYQLFYDHYSDLVLKGIEKLKEYWNKDTLKTSLDAEYEYDVGDIVGGNDKVTGIKVTSEITKKIVKIQKGHEEISYEIGE